MRLLDYLAQNTDCIALSELRDSTKYEQVLHILRTDACLEFPLEEWNYALSYILGTKLAMTDRSKLIDYFSLQEPKLPLELSAKK